MKQLRQINSGTEFAEREKIEKCKTIVYRVRQTLPKDPVFGVNFINIDTTLLDSDLNQDPGLRKSLESIGTVSTHGNSGIVHLDIKRVNYAPLWMWGVFYVLMASFDIFWLYLFSESMHEWIGMFYFLGTNYMDQ